MPVKATVNLKNVVRNAKLIRKTLPEKVKFCAVVKADAYGHGAAKVANALYRIADCFAVATVEEGVSLRFCGIDKDVLVLTSACYSEVARAVNYSLTLTAGGLTDLRRYQKEAVRQQREVKVHIKFNTGMNRQGIDDVKELEKAILFCKKSRYLKFCGLYSHFAAPECARSFRRAADKFAIAEKLVKGYDKDVICHISASGGFLRGAYYDMVRIGILLYGYKPFKTDALNVKPALKVTAPVVLRRSVRRGESALYGDKRVKRDAVLTLVRYGYADGLFRKEVKGQFNNRCMDLTAVKGVKEGVYRAAVMTDAEKTAKLYKTIPYEILVKCALRAQKFYLK